MRIGDTAQHCLHVADGGDQAARTHYRPGHKIVMTAQVFGGAVEDQIDAEIQGTLVIGRGKGTVDGDFHAMLRPMSTSLSRSMTRRCGFVGDSEKISRVVGRIAASRAS